MNNPKAPRITVKTTIKINSNMGAEVIKKYALELASNLNEIAEQSICDHEDKEIPVEYTIIKGLADELRKQYS